MFLLHLLTIAFFALAQLAPVLNWADEVLNPKEKERMARAIRIEDRIKSMMEPSKGCNKPWRSP